MATAMRQRRDRTAAGHAAAGVGALLIALARIVRLVAGIVALIIVVGIVLHLVSANMSNVIVRDIHNAASFLVGPFKNVFSLKNPKANVAANWGLAAVVYLIVGSVIASLLTRIAPSGAAPKRPVAA